MSARDFFAVVGRRRFSKTSNRQNECTRSVVRRCRRSSVIYLFRHRDGPVKKIKFSPIFKNKQSFQNSRFLVEMSVRVFFGFVGRRRRRSSVISLFRHRDGPVKKIKFSPVFHKQAIFPKFKIIRQNECTRFFRVVVVAVVGRLSFPSFVTGTDLRKKIKFSPVFHKTSNLSKIQDF